MISLFCACEPRYDLTFHPPTRYIVFNKRDSTDYSTIPPYHLTFWLSLPPPVRPEGERYGGAGPCGGVVSGRRRDAGWLRGLFPESQSGDLWST
jgi:hypothetical protein